MELWRPPANHSTRSPAWRQAASICILAVWPLSMIRVPRISPSQRTTLLLCLGLSLAVLAAYANHFDNEFHFDDFHTIVDNPAIADLRNIPRFFINSRLFSTRTTNQSYRPLTSVSLAVDYWLAGGPEPFYFHVSTFFWFLVQLVLMFFLFRRIMDAADPRPSNQWTALFATALYGLHPANAETINYIIQRADLYNTLGVVAGILLFARYPSQRKYGWYLLPVVAGILAKAPALIFPGILWCYVFVVELDGDFTASWAENRRKWLRASVAALPALAVSVVLAVLLRHMQPPHFDPLAAPGPLYLATQPRMALRYFTVFFHPAPLCADWYWAAVPSVFSRFALPGYLFVLLCCGLAIRAARTRRTRPIAFGILWFFLALLPTSAFPLSDVTNDHRMFFPFVGLALAAVWAMRLAVRSLAGPEPGRRSIAGTAVLAALVLVAAAAGTRQRNTVWHTEESLWRDVTIKSPLNARGWLNYGIVALKHTDYEAGADSFRRAFSLDPGCGRCEAWLALAYLGLHRYSEAAWCFRHAMEIGIPEPESLIRYTQWLRSTGRQSERIQLLQSALRRDPLSMPLRHELLLAYQEAEDWPAADSLARQILQIDPRDSEAASALATLPGAGR